jgi:hypothetical protein
MIWAATVRALTFAAATAKFKRGEASQIASYAIWQAEMKRCNDVLMSRTVAQVIKGMSTNCSLKLDWILRYPMMVYDLEQKAMAEDRCAEIVRHERQ